MVENEVETSSGVPGDEVQGDGAATEGAPALGDPVGWLLLYDPRWEARLEDEEAPSELIAGGWPAFGGGTIGSFFTNDLHRADPEVQSVASADPDPVGVALELVLRDGAPIELAQIVLRDCAVYVGMNGDGRSVIMRSEDDRLCVMAATCVERRDESNPPEWVRVGIDGLVTFLADGLDVLFNPDGPMPVRVSGPFVRTAAETGDAEGEVAFTYLVRTRAPHLFGAEVVGEGL